MSYLCKDCIHNNHGWCKALKRNKLKEIDKCAMKDDGNNPKKLREFETLTEIPAPNYPSPENQSEKDDINTESYRVLGKREMLWNIQKQAIAIKNDNNISDHMKFEVFCKCLKSLATIQDFSEDLYEVDKIIDSELDDLMIKDSKYISMRL